MKKTRAFLTFALTATVLLGGVAYATDGMVVDGDVSDGISVSGGGNPISESLVFGDVCPGDSILPSTPNVTMRVVRGNNDTNRFASLAVVAFTGEENNHLDVANGTIESTTPGIITLPSGWDSYSNNTMSDPTSAKVTLEVPESAVAGTYHASVEYRGNGQQFGGSVRSVTRTLPVSWTVLEADNEACDTVVPDPCAAVPTPAAPTFTYSPDGNPPWYVTIPTVVATSTTSGATVTYSLASAGPYGAAPTLSDGETTVFAIATSSTCSKVSTPSSQLYSVDTVNPSIEITSPDDGLSTLASSVTVSGTTSDATSGVAGVTVNEVAATTLDVDAGTFSRTGVALVCGTNTISAEATDNAGRTGSDSISVYRRCFTGSFLQPLDANGVLNKAKLGRVVPVKVTITANDGGSIPTPVYFGYRKVSCTAAAGEDVVESYAAGSSNTGNTFRLADGVWIYNLDTSTLPGALVGNCYQVDVYVGGTVDAAGIATGGDAIANGSVRIQLTK